MKALRNFLDKIKPQFEKGGKYEKFHSTFDAFETFLFVPDKVTHTGSHIRDALDMKRTMSMVIIALIPTLLFGIWNTGYQYFLSQGMTQVGFWEIVWTGLLKVLPIVIVSYVTGLSIEFAFAQARGHEVNEGFLVSGMLIPLIMPVNIPLWMVAVATAFAVILGKEAFGGTGMNVFNPALLARAFIFFAYPGDITGDKVWVAGLTHGEAVDGFSGATPLAHAASYHTELIPPLHDLFLGFIPGSIGETSKLAILIGAALLIITGIGSWKIMVSALTGGITMSLIFNLVGANPYMQISPLTQIMMGSFLFGIVYMATDPVSAAQTEKGKYIYGFLIGLFSLMIRVFNPAYPEGTMLAILLMNTFAPLIDHYVVEANIKRRMKRSAKLTNA